jgi:uncharacterized membrane protein YccC
MELVLSVLVGAAIAAVLLVAFMVWLNRCDERRRQQMVDDVERAERRLAERIGPRPRDPA